MLGQFLAFLPADFAFVDEVALVADQDFTHIIVGKLFNFQHPLPHVLESFPISDIVDDDDAVGTPIVTGRQRSKPFLSSGIPYLELDVLSVHFYCFYFEINADRVEKVVVERVFLQDKPTKLSYEGGKGRWYLRRI